MNTTAIFKNKGKDLQQKSIGFIAVFVSVLSFIFLSCCKKGLVLIFLVFFLSRTVYGMEIDNINLPRLHFSQEYRYENGTRGKSLFLFSDSAELKSHRGNLTLFRSNITITEDFTGNIYAFFSQVNIEEGVSFRGNIYTVSSLVHVAKGVRIHIQPVIFFLKYLDWEQMSDGYMRYDDQLHVIVIYFCIGVLRETFCLIIIGLKKAFLEQGSVLLLYEPFSLIQNGLLAYFIILSLGLVFLMSVVGALMTLFLALAAALLVLVGQTSLNIFIGYFIMEKLKIKFGTYANGLIGGIIIEVISFIPILRYVVNFLFMPMLCLGIVFTNLINGFIKKKFYLIPYTTVEETLHYADIDKIRGIVVKNIKKP